VPVKNQVKKAVNQQNSANQEAMKKTPEDVVLKIRRVVFSGKSNWHRVWIKSDPLASHFGNNISVCLEELEKFVMTAVKRARLQLKNPKLVAQIDVFLQQEQQHNELHHSLNQYLVDQGYVHVTNAVEFYQKRYGHLLESSSLSDLKQLLRLACQFEHLAATVGRYFLKLLSQNSVDMDYPTAYLFAYHAVEELEHKGVCFDCFQSLFGESPLSSESSRTEWLQFTEELKASTVFGVRYFLHADHLQLGTPAPSESNIQARLWGEDGIIPLHGDYYRYIEPGFHPWDIDDRALIDAWDHRVEPQWREKISQLM
jgi:uncharacterized protein